MWPFGPLDPTKSYARIRSGAFKKAARYRKPSNGATVWYLRYNNYGTVLTVWYINIFVIKILF